MLCQFMVAHHTFYVQILNADRLVFAEEHCGLFLQKIGTLVGYLFMHSSNTDALLVAVSRTFLPAGEPSLFPAESAFRAFQIRFMSSLLILHSSPASLKASATSSSISILSLLTFNTSSSAKCAPLTSACLSFKRYLKLYVSLSVLRYSLFLLLFPALKKTVLLFLYHSLVRREAKLTPARNDVRVFLDKIFHGFFFCDRCRVLSTEDAGIILEPPLQALRLPLASAQAWRLFRFSLS